MKYADKLCAWLIFGAGILHIVLTDFFHLRGSLDTALVWVFASMLNLLRIRNGYSVPHLKIFCAGANVSVLMLEAVRWRLFEGSLSLAIFSLFLIETLFTLTAWSQQHST
jgi:hypothetical protein